MLLDRYNYSLPDELIAQRPASPRDSSRILVVTKKDGNIDILSFSKIKKYFTQHDLAVFNNTKVDPFLIRGYDKRNTLREFLLIENIESLKWKVMTKNPKNSDIIFGTNLNAKLLKDKNSWLLIFDKDPNEFLKSNGLMPIPPYLKRESDFKDSTDYQTVYAKVEGSIAAPTAGLHFTDELLNNFIITKDFVTLHVGMGTFLPVKTKNISEHKMHEELFFINAKTFKNIETIKSKGGKILSIGTTTLRALESAAIDISLINKWSSTTLFIKENFEFKIADCLLTNFHLPKSTLLILVSAFLGYELTMKCYEIAIKEKMRFYSYGDAMLIL